MGVPDPLNERPSISMLIGMRNTSPVNSTWVCRLSMPEVPSKIYTTPKQHHLNTGSQLGRIAYLDDGSLSGDFKNLTLSDATVSKSDVDDLSVSIQEIRGHR